MNRSDDGPRSVGGSQRLAHLHVRDVGFDELLADPLVTESLVERGGAGLRVQEERLESLGGGRRFELFHDAATPSLASNVVEDGNTFDLADAGVRGVAAAVATAVAVVLPQAGRTDRSPVAVVGDEVSRRLVVFVPFEVLGHALLVDEHRPANGEGVLALCVVPGDDYPVSYHCRWLTAAAYRGLDSYRSDLLDLRQVYSGGPPTADMADLGKVDREFFDERIYPRLGADRDDVAVGPKHGVDFGLLDLDGTAVVVATDPLSVLPQLGFDRAGRFALHVVLSDVAVSGLLPTHLAVSFTLPPEMTDEQFAELWAAVDDECSSLGISIVTGHTARYGGVDYSWVGGATAMAVGDPDDVVRPDGARPGDKVLVTKGPAVETTGLLTTLFPDQFDLPDGVLSAAQSRLDETRTVRDAVTAAAAGPVTAMHDATEGGLFGALDEVAESAGVRLDVDTESIPVRPGVREVCEYLDIDPWLSTSSGTLVMTVGADGVDDVVAEVAARGTPVAVVGDVTAGDVSDGDGVYLDGERLEHPGVDPSWEAYERLAARNP